MNECIELDYNVLFILFSIVYVILAVAVLLVLRYYFKRHPVEKELDYSSGEGSMKV